MQFYKRLWVDSNLSTKDLKGFPWGLTLFKVRKTKEIRRIFWCCSDLATVPEAQGNFYHSRERINMSQRKRRRRRKGVKGMNKGH